MSARSLIVVAVLAACAWLAALWDTQAPARAPEPAAASATSAAPETTATPHDETPRAAARHGSGPEAKPDPRPRLDPRPPMRTSMRASALEGRAPLEQDRAAEPPEPPAPNTLPRPGWPNGPLAHNPNEFRKAHEERYADALAQWQDEAREAAWADAREAELSQAIFAGRDDRPDQPVDPECCEVECRTTQCRIEVSLASPRALFALRGATTLRSQVGGQVVSGVQESEEGTKKLVLFIPRDTQDATE